MIVHHFQDIFGNVIKLDEHVWCDHISRFHPEMSKDLIADVLLSPSVVCESQHKMMVSSLQYYKGPWISHSGKTRFHRIIVKRCCDGSWISTAHTRARWTCGLILYRDGQ